MLQGKQRGLGRRGTNAFVDSVPRARDLHRDRTESLGEIVPTVLRYSGSGIG